MKVFIFIFFIVVISFCYQKEDTLDFFDSIIKVAQDDLKKDIVEMKKSVKNTVKKAVKKVPKSIKKDVKKAVKTMKRGLLFSAKQENKICTKLTVEDLSEKQKSLSAKGAALALNLVYLKPDVIEKFQPTQSWGFDPIEKWERNIAYVDENQEIYCVVVSSSVTKEVIVATRGTTKKALKDWEIDFNPKKVKSTFVGVGKVHKGWNKKSKLILSKIRDVIKVFKDYRILFAGHSSGAAVSSILAASFYKLNIPNVKPDIEVLAFASPRPGTRKFGEAVMQLIPRSVSYVNGNDPVTNTPPITLGYFHATRKITIDHCKVIFGCHTALKYYTKYMKYIKNTSMPAFSKLGK